MTTATAAAFDYSQHNGPDFSDLATRIGGSVILPDHDEYETARRGNSLMYDRRPGAIARVSSEQDVVECVKFAWESGLELSVRSGGHSIAGLSIIDGALVVDLSSFRSVTIDPERRTARCQSGATSHDLAVPAHAYGLAMSTGDTSTVGLGGLVTGGGLGYMVRKYGLAADNVLSVRMVTARGEVVTASKDENPDLFWAVRGGGGNFGIITEFEFRLAPVGAVLGGEVYIPATRENVRRYLELAEAAPDELTTLANLRPMPPAPFIPADRVGELAFDITVCYTGDLEEGERVVAPFREIDTPIVDVISPMPYPSIFEFMAPAEQQHLAALRSSFTNEVSDETIDGMIAAAANATSPFSMVHIRVLGGAFGRVAVDATAFAHRDKRFWLTAIGLWFDPEEDRAPHIRWATELWQSWQSFAEGVYVNFLASEGELRVRQAYPKAAYDRLAQVKRRWDPGNVFHNNQNVRPRP